MVTPCLHFMCLCIFIYGYVFMFMCARACTHMYSKHITKLSSLPLWNSSGGIRSSDIG